VTSSGLCGSGCRMAAVSRRRRAGTAATVAHLKRAV
jgi:hypothetical protein